MALTNEEAEIGVRVHIPEHNNTRSESNWSNPRVTREELERAGYALPYLVIELPPDDEGDATVRRGDGGYLHENLLHLADLDLYVE